MATTVVALKLTQTELEVLDWLADQDHSKNRSAALRYALTFTARQRGVQVSALLDAADERREPRRGPRYRKAPKTNKRPAARSNR